MMPSNPTLHGTTWTMHQINATLKTLITGMRRIRRGVFTHDTSNMTSFVNLSLYVPKGITNDQPRTANSADFPSKLTSCVAGSMGSQTVTNQVKIFKTKPRPNQKINESLQLCANQSSVGNGLGVVRKYCPYSPVYYNNVEVSL